MRPFDMREEEQIPIERYLRRHSNTRFPQNKYDFYVETLDKVIITEQEIEKRIEKIAEEIVDTYKSENNILNLKRIVLLQGATYFNNRLKHYLGGSAGKEDFMKPQSYGDAIESSGEVKLEQVLSNDVHPEERLLIIEDIEDTGKTLESTKSYLKSKVDNEIKIAVLMDKPSGRDGDGIPIDYCGFIVPGKFLVGCGLNHLQMMRDLPFVATVKKEYEDKNNFKEAMQKYGLL